MYALLAFLTAPVTLTGTQHMLLLAPLCLGISVVYKTVKTERLRDLPAAALALWVTILVGMYAVGVGAWLLYLLLA